MKRLYHYAAYAFLGAFALGAGVWVAQQRYTPDDTAQAAHLAVWQTTFTDLQGRPQSLSQWRNKMLVVNFWATWCAPCREEIPDLNAIRREYAAKNLEIVGIGIDNAAAMINYTRSVPIDYPIWVGENNALELSRALGNPAGALPYTVVFAPDGTILLRHLGRLPKNKLQAILDNSAQPAPGNTQTGSDLR